LLSAGLTRHMVETRRASGFLTQVHHGVYIVGPVVDMPFARETAALLAVDRSVLSHLTAGGVYELIRLLDDAPIHVTVRHPRKSRPGITVHRSSAITRADVTLYEGLPITSVARTLLDLAEMLSVRDTERALDEALARKLVTLAEIRELLTRAT